MWGKKKPALKPFIIEGVTDVQKHVMSIAACTTALKGFRVRSQSFATCVGRQPAYSLVYERCDGYAYSVGPWRERTGLQGSRQFL